VPARVYRQNPSRIVDYWCWLIDAEVLHLIGQDALVIPRAEAAFVLFHSYFASSAMMIRPFVLQTRLGQ
jgi:hypothetical protein